MANWYCDIGNSTGGASDSNAGKGWYSVNVASAAGLAVGNTITGNSGAVSAIILNIVTNTLYITQAVGGSFVNSENCKVGGSTVTTFSNPTGYAVACWLTTGKMTTSVTGCTAGDALRIVKSPVVASTGITASVNNLSKTVTLASALNLMICDCSTTTGWTTSYYAFTITSGNATIGATYTNSGRTFTVTKTIASQTYLCSNGTADPAASGTLTLASGTGDATLTYSAFAKPTFGLNTSQWKEGSQSLRIQLPAGVISVNTLFAVFDIGSDQNCSAYQWLEFWHYVSGSNYGLNGLTIKLLDSSNAVLHTFNQNYVYGANFAMQQFSIDNGSALASNVRKIAFYTGSANDISGFALTFDDIIVSQNANLHLTDLITFSSATQIDNTEAWAIQSINGTTLIIDNNTANYGTAGRGYTSNTNPVGNITSQTLYYWRPIRTVPGAAYNTNINTLGLAGTVNNWTNYEGGYNITTNSQDGETLIDGQNGNGMCFYTNSLDYQSINRFGFIRFSRGIETSGLNFYKIKNIIGISCATIIDVVPYKIYLDGYQKIINCTTSFITFNISEQLSGLIKCYGSLGTQIKFNYNSLLKYGIECKNNADSAIYFLEGSENSIINNYISANNSTSSIYILCANGNIYFNNALIGESPEIAYNSGVLHNHNTSIIFSKKHNQTAGNDKAYALYCTRTKQTTQKPADASVAYKISPTNVLRRRDFKYYEYLGSFLCSANNQCTVKLRVYKDNAAINGGIFIRGQQIAGVPDDIELLSTNTTDWTDGNSLLTQTFTPTEAGWIDVYAVCYYPDTSSVYTYSVYVAPPAADVNGNIPLFTQV